MVKYWLVFAIGLVASLGLFLLLPMKYQITVSSSRYYRLCGTQTTASCQSYNPPQIINRQKAYYLAWSEQTDISRQLSIKETSTSWSPGSSFGRHLGLSMIPAVAGTGWLVFGLARRKKPADLKN